MFVGSTYRYIKFMQLINVISSVVQLILMNPSTIDIRVFVVRTEVRSF